MSNDSDRTQNIPVKLENGRIIYVEVTQTGREDVALGAASEFEEVTDALEGIVQAIAETINQANPTKATVKFGLEIAVESGKLIAVLGKGSAKANLEIALEWTKEAGAVKIIG